MSNIIETERATLNNLTWEELEAAIILDPNKQKLIGAIEAEKIEAIIARKSEDAKAYLSAFNKIDAKLFGGKAHDWNEGVATDVLEEAARYIAPMYDALLSYSFLSGNFGTESPAAWEQEIEMEQQLIEAVTKDILIEPQSLLFLNRVRNRIPLLLGGHPSTNLKPETLVALSTLYLLPADNGNVAKRIEAEDLLDPGYSENSMLRTKGDSEGLSLYIRNPDFFSGERDPLLTLGAQIVINPYLTSEGYFIEDLVSGVTSKA